MSKALVIVESPAKAKTISKYLGKDYTVEASVGHIKDLPKNKIGVDLTDGTFEPELIVIPGKEKVVDRLKKLAAKSDQVYLAPDPDREGEAIAAHLADELSKVVKKQRNPSCHLQRNHAEGRQRRLPACTQRRLASRRCTDNAPCARPHCRLPGLTPALGQSTPRPLRGPRADRRRPPHRRTRARNQGLQSRRILDDRRRTHSQKSTHSLHDSLASTVEAEVETVDAPSLPDQRDQP